MAQKIKSKDEKALISLTEATKYCNYSQEYLSLRARNKKLKSVKVGRNWMTTTGWLNEYLQRVDQYKEQVSFGSAKGSIRETKAVFADENAGETTPDIEPAIEPIIEPAPVIEQPAEPMVEPQNSEPEQPVEIAPAETKPTEPIEVPQETTPLEIPSVPDSMPMPPIETPVEDTEATVVSYKKEIAPPGNLPSEDELLKKYIPYEYPSKDGLGFGYVIAFTIVMVLAGFTFGADSFGVFFNDIKEYGSLVKAGSGSIGTDLAQYSSYSLSYSAKILSDYMNWLSSLLF